MYSNVKCLKDLIKNPPTTLLFVVQSKVSAKTYEDELMPGSDDDSHDAYLEQMKAEGAERDDDSESSEGALCVMISIAPLLTKSVHCKRDGLGE